MTLSGLSLSRSTSDRAAHLRADADLLDRLWADPATRVLRVGDGRAPVAELNGHVALALAPPGEVAPAREPVFLGVDDSGVAYVAVAETPGEDWAGLRDVGALLDDRDAGLLTEAVAVLNWHATHRHCPRCGTPTEPVQAGWARRCPADGSEHYPRTDPAVIMTVVDADDRVLLGHSPRWPQGRYSTLAGFVEPGESLEAAVRREVAEEAGVVVGEVTYLGSQPWPFPASLMLGFTAHAVSPDIAVDGVEIADARWFSREELAEAVRTGEVLLPPRVSIARRLVERWYGGEITDAREAWR